MDSQATKSIVFLSCNSILVGEIILFTLYFYWSDVFIMLIILLSMGPGSQQYVDLCIHLSCRSMSQQAVMLLHCAVNHNLYYLIYGNHLSLHVNLENVKLFSKYSPLFQYVPQTFMHMLRIWELHAVCGIGYVHFYLA